MKQGLHAISYKRNFSLVEKIETNIHLEQPFYLLTKTWKYMNGGSVFGIDILLEELINVINVIEINVRFQLIIMDYNRLVGAKMTQYVENNGIYA